MSLKEAELDSFCWGSQLYLQCLELCFVVMRMYFNSNKQLNKSQLPPGTSASVLKHAALKRRPFKLLHIVKPALIGFRMFFHIFILWKLWLILLQNQSPDLFCTTLTWTICMLFLPMSFHFILTLLFTPERNTEFLLSASNYLVLSHEWQLSNLST